MMLPPSRTKRHPKELQFGVTIHQGKTAAAKIEPDPETMPIAMENIATTARSRTTGKKNVEKGSVNMNHANTGMDELIGQKHM